MVLALVEHDNGQIEDESLEALTLAGDVADQAGESLEAIAFGPEAEGVASDVGDAGVEVVHVVEHDDLDGYAPQAWAETVGQCATELDAQAVVAPGTDRGNEVLSHAAAKADTGLSAATTEVETGDVYEVTRQRWGGTLIEHAKLSGDVKLLTTAVNEISPVEAGGDADVSAFTPDLDDSDLEVQLTSVEEDDTEGVPLGEARVVVSGGRGTDGDFSAVEELAKYIPNSAVGSSRAAVNEGWRPHDDQVGQTGTKISPELYIPTGISGAVQHMVGCKGAENILAVNTDPEAAIIQKADWAVVADLHEVLPAVVEELESRGYSKKD
ncbi:MAG: electron transfer flavoprotein subunit alpha/FixB family protein [Haloarculaceae archaeon]